MTNIIIGANSEIAKALANKLMENTPSKLVLISRSAPAIEFIGENVEFIQVNDYSEHSIKQAANKLKSSLSEPVAKVFVCNGILQNDELKPEKKIEDFNQDNFQQVLIANTITPMLWLQHLVAVISGNHTCKFVLFSARVGSISDNKLGGWYSYRASKAALNMLIKTAAIELARRAKNVKLIAFHPGTTDTPLSKPFQNNVPKHKLFTPAFVADQLLEILEQFDTKQPKENQSASFIDWQGKDIQW